MSHHIYKTDAFVLGSSNIGEANRYIDILTKDIGRIRAVAKSIREEKSKLRFSLQDFSVAHLSIVRGRDVWRVVGAEGEYNICAEFSSRQFERDIILRLASLLRRLVAGEEKNRRLFGILIEAFSFLKKHELKENELRDFECLIVLRVLYNLGYLAKDVHTSSFIDSRTTTLNLIEGISPLRFEMIKKINASLQETQL